MHTRGCRKVMEEQSEVRHKGGRGRWIPCGAPKNGEDLDGSERRPAAVSKPGRDCRCNPLQLRPMEWHDADRVLQCCCGFLETRLGGHEALLVRADEFS